VKVQRINLADGDFMAIYFMGVFKRVFSGITRLVIQQGTKNGD
jgi:hypothetical protein